MCRPEGGRGKRDAGSSKGKCSCGRLVPNDKSRIGFSTPQHQGKSTCWGSRLVSERPVGQRSTRFVREFGAVCRLSADLVQIFLHYQRPGAHELETNEAEYQIRDSRFVVSWLHRSFTTVISSDFFCDKINLDENDLPTELLTIRMTFTWSAGWKTIQWLTIGLLSLSVAKYGE